MIRIYSTVQGDTWDKIAFTQLGSEKFTSLLITYNPTYIHTVIFNAGCQIIIPEVDNNIPDTLPPWMI